MAKSRRVRLDDDEEPGDVVEVNERPRQRAAAEGKTGGHAWLWGLLAAGLCGVLLIGCCGGGMLFLVYGTGLGSDPLTPKSVPDAVQRLKGNQSDQQKAAAEWLAHQPLDPQQQQSVALALDPLIGTPNTAVSVAALHALEVWATADNVPSLIAFIDNPNQNQFVVFGISTAASDQQTQAVNVLVKLDDDRALPTLAGAAVRGNTTAATYLERTAPKGTKALLAFFNDPRYSSAARNQLRRMKTPEHAYAEQSLHDLRSNDAGIKRNAVTYFSNAPLDEGLRTEVERALAPLVSNLDVMAQPNDSAIVALVRWATKESVPTLIRFTEAQHWPGADDAVWNCLAGMDDDRAARRIIEVWHQEALGRRGPWRERIVRLGPRAEPLLLKLIDTPESWKQQQVCYMLGEVGTKASLPALRALNDKPKTRFDQVIPLAAASAIAKIEERGK